MGFVLTHAIPEPRCCPVCGEEAKNLTASGYKEQLSIRWLEKLAECPNGHLWRFNDVRWEGRSDT